MDDLKAPRRARLQGWLLFLLFAGPLAVAAYLYYDTAWRPGGTVNHGDLVVPPVPLPEAALPTPEGERTQADFLKHHWSLVYLDRHGCDAACREALHTGRQMRLALGHQMERVRRVYLYMGEPPDPAYFEAEHPDMLVASVAGPEGEAVRQAFSGQAEGYWLVDPLGNVMMRYPQDAGPKGMLEDLKRLLRLSRIG
jgi:hypothetical protein